MANDFIGIVEELKKYNRVVIACSLQDIEQDVIREYLEKLVDYFPHEITLEKQVKTRAIIETINSTIKDIDNRQSLKDELKKLINLLSDELESGSYNYHKNFTDLFAKNSSDAINLRSIKKVFSQMYQLDNADKIIKVIVDIVSEDIARNITFDNIKNYYRYLKTKEKIQIYLVAYELLFTYPKLSSIVNDYYKSSKIKDPDWVPNMDVFDKKDKKKLDLSKYIKDKDIEKINFLSDKVGDFRNLNFRYVDKLLEEIDSLSTINDNDLLRDLVLGKSIQVEKYFTCEDLSVKFLIFAKRFLYM